ncbi:MAG: penicillin-binding transpeptidase domain-containing protein [Oscillospiraceae bacterium]|nr:penicillin-binding transpeptidase domain-containing protein [Oscillospiraceae bacterium]
MEGTRLYIRIGVLALMTLGMASAVVVTLFRLHTTPLPASSAPQTADARYYSYETVPAARGEIYDRYSRELVVNRLSRDIGVGAAALKAAENKAEAPPESASRAVLDLLMLCEEAGVGHEDTFPVTLYPYSYIDNDSAEAAQSFRRLSAFLERAGLPAEMTADELMRVMRVRYNIPREWTNDDARRVAGVRYEAELRYEFAREEPYIYIAPYVFARDIPVSLMTRIMERGLPGVTVSNTVTREYRTKYAAHLLGRVGPIFEDEREYYQELGYGLDALVGKDGIERAAEQWLRGASGQKRVETNSEGQVTVETYTREPQAGGHVLSTLDLRLQEAAERALARGIARLRNTATPRDGSEAQGGAAAVIDIKTGDVLAMASYPTFDLSSYMDSYAALLDDPLNPLFNRALSGAYEPGSVFKMCTGIAALEAGAIKANTHMYDRGIYTYYVNVDPNFTPRCLIYPGSHGSVNVAAALKVSCNYFFYEAGRLAGIEKINEYAAALGLGQATGIELDFAESAGVLAGPAYTSANGLRWNPGDTIQSAIGQSYNMFTPLQMAVYTAAIANGGTRYRPHLIKSVMAYDYQRAAYDIRPEVLSELEFTPENIRAIQSGMRMVTQAGGTAYAAFADYEVAVAAKTGTAQTSTAKPDNGVFVAYAPYGDPEIAIAVVVEKGAGGSRAAPIARDIFEAYFSLKERMNGIEP